jgi:RNA polymerase sigma-70 factor (ECF subfamily)
MVVDDRIRELVERGESRRAAQLLVESYGAEVFAYVTSLVKDEDVAVDAFATACENVIQSVGAFRGNGSARSWFYAVARHATYRQARAERKHRGERISALAEALQAPIRSMTAIFQRTAVKDEISKLREQLSDDERELLVLRVDRGLSWIEIATVRAGQGESEDALKREAARCRKQFERTKLHLRELAERAGLLGDGS